MTKHVLGALAALMMTAGLAMAQTQAPNCQQSDCCQQVCCDSMCCGGSMIDFEVEATFFRYHREDGLAAANEFDFDAGYRLSATIAGNNGVDFRIRYWEHDATAGTVAAPVSVDTYNLDFEAVYEVCLDSCTTLEVSAGIRYNDFEEDGIISAVATAPAQRFDGFGGIIALELTRDLNCNTSMYARVRQGIMMDDAEFDGTVVIDVTRAISEVAFGVNYCYCGWNIHAGLEWQDWGSYVDAVPAGITTESIGFAGYVVGAEFSY